MANEVYANGREIACKAASGKTTAAFPDTCLSPPSPPAGPIPIPYPNTACASDTTNGSTSVMISSQEVMLKDESTFKKSTGDEAATKSLGMGVVTHTIQGEASFVAWSMDVKIEGHNADRHLDMTINNEQCNNPANDPPWPYLDAAALGRDSPCNKRAPKNYAKQVKDNCKVPKKSRATRADFIGGKLVAEPKPGPQDNTSKKCCDARKCMMVPEHPKSRCKECGMTAHHPLPASEFEEHESRGQGTSSIGAYNSRKAPCLCVVGKDHDHRDGNGRIKEHGRLGAEYTQQRNLKFKDHPDNYKYSDGSAIAAKAAAKITGCDEECIKAQLDAGHHAMGVKDNDTLRMSTQKANIPERKPRSKTRSAR
jgi:hypothetical protein